MTEKIVRTLNILSLPEYSFLSRALGFSFQFKRLDSSINKDKMKMKPKKTNIAKSMIS